MKTLLAAAVAACSLAASFPLAAQDADENLDELETVVIVGGYATPRLWKVSKDDHVMWVLGNSGPAPAGVQWRTEQIDARVGESQLILYPGWATTGVDIGILKTITLLPAMYKAAKNPDDKTLKDVLPAQIYARWRVLKTEYLGRDNSVEKFRPSIAMEQLEGAVLKKSGLAKPKPGTTGPSVRSVVDKAARKHKVKSRTMPIVKREVKVTNAREILKSTYHQDLGDAQCFAQRLDYVEHVIEYAKQSANAAGESRADSRPVAPRKIDCADVFIKGLRSGEIPDPAGALKVLDEAALQAKLGLEQLEAEWLAAAQAAIAKNKSTFAMLSMNHVMSLTGYLVKLKELGYTVEEPN